MGHSAVKCVQRVVSLAARMAASRTTTHRHGPGRRLGKAGWLLPAAAQLGCDPSFRPMGHGRCCLQDGLRRLRPLEDVSARCALVRNVW